MHILVIDDDAAMRESIGLVLESAGFTVVEAKNGIDGMRLLQAEHPALVITDILMPQKEGIEIIREIRAQAPDIPIIAISGAVGGQADYLKMARAFGANAVLAKPFEPKEMLAVAQRLLDTSAPQSF